MGELRDRMVQDMRVRNLSVRTIESYVAAVRGLAKYDGRSPETLSNDEVHRDLIHVREERKLSGSSCQLIRCGLRFRYGVTLQQPHVCLTVPPAREPQKLPEILSREEVGSILDATRTLYGLLFRAAAATLLAFARDSRHLGAEPAITMVLHTWGQNLSEHVHVHCVVSGGGLSPDGSRWVASPRSGRRRPFLFPVKALSQTFRGKYLAGLDRLRRTGARRFAGQSAVLGEAPHWHQLIATLRRHSWVVYAKPPFGGPERVLKYLSRYTHRVAISNHRLRFVGDGMVRFRWTDYADHDRKKEMTLPATEFLRRFLLHVVPRGFMRIRHYGLLANCQRTHKLTRCRQLLARTPPLAAPAGLEDQDSGSTADTPPDAPPPCGPICGGPLRVVELLAPSPHDTS